MHNNIMAAGSRDRPPMLATGRYAQWRSRFLRYIDTRPNGDALRKCILKGPYTPTIVTTPAVPATEDSPAVPEQTTVETVTNMTPENRAHFESEKEAIHLILTGIGDEIYSTVDACQTAQEMWEAIERLQQGESLNIQDVKTNLFWEFGQFTSHDGETIESYYTRFYKMMNEMIRNNLTVATMQVNVQFLQQLQPEWSRFVTIVKQQHKLDEVSYHKLKIAGPHRNKISIAKSRLSRHLSGTMIHVAKEEMYNFLPNAASTWELTIRRVPIDGLAEFSQVDLTGRRNVDLSSYFATMISGMEHMKPPESIQTALYAHGDEVEALHSQFLMSQYPELTNADRAGVVDRDSEQKIHDFVTVEDPLLKDDKLEDIQAISDLGILKLSKNTEKKGKNLYSTLGVGVCCSGSVINSSASGTYFLHKWENSKTMIQFTPSHT
ncbi:hypothetical protein Tco_0150046 [Tanacetum coccineum]